MRHFDAVSREILKDTYYGHEIPHDGDYNCELMDLIDEGYISTYSEIVEDKVNGGVLYKSIFYEITFKGLFLWFMLEEASKDITRFVDMIRPDLAD